MQSTPPAARFGRIVTAMATPFTPSGALDLEGARRLARRLVEDGNDGLVLSGSTGEAPTLSDDERVALWEAVIDAVDVPVIAGATSNDTAHSLALVHRAEQSGAAAVLAVTPYYNRPSQSGLEAHFRAIAGATQLPVILYDIPIRTGRRIARETMLSLARDVENIVAVKDATGDPAATARLLAEAPPGFECYSGDDALTLPLLSVGAVGLIGVATHWCARECGEMINQFFEGDVAGALATNRGLLESFDFETSDEAPNPLPVKAMLRVLGLPAGECRLPLGVAPGGLEDRAKSVIEHLEAWRGSRAEGFDAKT
ncbi:MAG: 4-hydroxy-tetrahydrodipicolinate synthase [Acidimicrobiaceae bacterium]|nr:4-hydroxy-tetrahydrodipicolinate synthase [Acidimicrobiaceae bacterium]